MTDEEFERLKEAEKRHLREKKKMRRTLDAVKRRNRTEGILQKMKEGAQRLLRETESLVDSLQSQVARNQAQLEVALDGEEGDDLEEAEEALREERAKSLVRQYKAASGAPSASQPRTSPVDETSGAERDTNEGPEKTIGRMRTPRSDDET